MIEVTPEWMQKFAEAGPEQRMEMVNAMQAMNRREQQQRDYDERRWSLAFSLMERMEPATWMESADVAAKFAVSAADALLVALGKVRP